MDKIYQQLKEIFREVFDNDDIVIDADTNADDIEEWDSLTHTNLILMIELKFDIEFQTKEIREFRNVGDMAAAIQKHISN